MDTNSKDPWQLTAISAIQNNWIPHRNQLRAESSIYTTLITASPGDVIVVVGPSRVGKSTLTEMIGERVVRQKPNGNDLFKPFIRISTRNGGQGGKFTTKSFLLSALKIMGHPMLSNSLSSFYDLTITRQLDRVKAETLQASFEDSIRHLKVKYLLIDEVQHLEHIAGGLENVLPILDGWKSLAEDLGIVLILTGAYPILQVMLQSPHMIGRKSEIHFPRYHPDNANDVAEFCRILITLDQIIGAGQHSSLINSAEFIYRGSLGCIGLLNNWVINALRASSIQGSNRLLEDHLKETRRSNSDIETMLQEIQFGEELMRNDLAIASFDFPGQRTPQSGKRSTRRGRPFESRLKRHPVGKGDSK